MRNKTLKGLMVGFILVLAISLIYAAWSAPPKWHYASDVKILHTTGPTDLQSWITDRADIGSMAYDWEEADHTTWEEAENIRVALGSGAYQNLQDWIDKKSTAWTTKSRWHSANEIKIVNEEGTEESLQDWINEQDDIEPWDGFFRYGDIVSFKEWKHDNAFLNVHGNNRLYADGSSVEGPSGQFTILKDSDRTDIGDVINDRDRTILNSVLTTEDMEQHDRVRENWIYFKTGYDSLHPEIIFTDEIKETSLKCGSNISLKGKMPNGLFGRKKDDRFIDIAFDGSSNPAHFKDENIFTIFDSTGDCDPTNN